MKSNLQYFRWLSTRLPDPSARRLVVITGARQTGKTTLARRVYPGLRHLNLDDQETRDDLRALRTRAWARTVGPAVIDEAQKEPSVFEKVKFAYDEGELDFSVLLGSSRILLLDRVKESLAGRAFIYDLYPLMPGELLAPEGTSPRLPLLDRLLDGKDRIGQTLAAQPARLIGSESDAAQSALEHLEAWGGMPELLRLEDDERRDFLRSYQQTFLERDLLDLARLADLQPFRKLQRLAMLRSASLLSYSELARDAGLSVSTARRYLEYLSVSYQTVLLEPYSQNLTSRSIKTPKLYFVDMGILRQGTGIWGPATGELFENLVVAEVHKWVRTMAREVSLSFYRTRSGLEVDLLIEGAGGLVGLEIKARDAVHGTDLRALRPLCDAVGPRWRGGLVVYRGRAVECLDEERDIWAMPAHRLFGPGR